jgi:hypothetical protein
MTETKNNENAERVNKMIMDKKVVTIEEDRRVSDLKAARDRKELETHPHFQRNPGIWRLDKKSLLIESILANIPIPQIYIAEAFVEETRTVDEVVDGQQRLTTIFDFMDGVFALKGLQIYEDVLEGRKFDGLPLPLQERISRCTLHLVKIMRTSDPDVKYAMFMRLNHGSVSLNKQEFRECYYYSPLVELIRELAETPYFKDFMNEAIPEKTRIRRKPEELVAEALAFHVLPDDVYKQKSGFIDVFYSIYKAPKYTLDCPEFKKWHDDFTETCLTIRKIFGRYPFRNLVDKDGCKIPKKFSEAIYRIYMTIFMEINNHKLARRHADDFLQVIKEKLYKNKEFLLTISATTNDGDLGLRSTSDIYKIRKGLDIFRDFVKNSCKEIIPRLADEELELLKQQELDNQEKTKQRNLAEWEAKKDG